MERCGSLPLSLASRSSFFADFTAESALPFACWCPGLLVLCSIYYSFAKWRNASEVNHCHYNGVRYAVSGEVAP